tara:strand:+ start:543 stop:1349 length:807 start_codon:yes stop_codon:yes gene_type:complete
MQDMRKILLFIFFLISPFFAYAGEIVIQSTTSTKNSGFYDFIISKVKKSLRIDVKVVAVGTGQAISNAKRCDGDVLLVHDIEAERDFVKEGYGLERYNLMYNDFIFVGPSLDNLRLRNKKDTIDVLRTIYDSKVIFLSRSDNSGTHNKEKKLWKSAGLEPLKYSGKWYLETGLGMGATLNIAAGKNAYTITDRATWISFKNKSDLQILFDDDPQLFNQYGIIVVNPARCPNVNIVDANRFLRWIISDEGKSTISSFKIGNQQLFFPSK